VPEGSGTFAHSSRKTPFSAMMACLGAQNHHQEAFFKRFFFLLKTSTGWLAIPEKDQRMRFFFFFLQGCDWSHGAVYS
jgi:hypothetical protein